jgi:hypothetical protein
MGPDTAERRRTERGRGDPRLHRGHRAEEIARGWIGSARAKDALCSIRAVAGPDGRRITPRSRPGESGDDCRRKSATNLLPRHDAKAKAPSSAGCT